MSIQIFPCTRPDGKSRTNPLSNSIILSAPLDNYPILYMIQAIIRIRPNLSKSEANMFKRSWLCRYILLSASLFGLTGFAHPVVAQEATFTYNNFSLTLPEGWMKQDPPKGSEKEVVGSLKSEKIQGTTILVLCYKGWRYDYRSIRIAGLKTIASVYPKGQEALKKETKLKTDGGLTAVTELWRGVVDAGGTTVSLQSPMGIMETKAG